MLQSMGSESDTIEQLTELKPDKVAGCRKSAASAEINKDGTS